MYAVAKTTDPEDRAWVYMNAAGDFGRIQDARIYDDLKTARGVARVMWWEARAEERVFVFDTETDEVLGDLEDEFAYEENPPGRTHC